MTLAQILCIDLSLLLQDKLLLLRLIRGRETLPWERAAEEVEKHIPKRFPIVTAMLHLEGYQSLRSKDRGTRTYQHLNDR